MVHEAKAVGTTIWTSPQCDAYGVADALSELKTLAQMAWMRVDASVDDPNQALIFATLWPDIRGAQYGATKTVYKVSRM